MTAAPHASRRIVLDLCPLCGGTSWTMLVDGGTTSSQWVRCACTLVYKRSDPAIPDDGADGHAAASYDAAYFERYARRRRRRVAKARRQILDAMEVAPAGPLLDVGCSLGYTLEASGSLGLEAAGVDLSEHAVEACRRQGWSASQGTLERLPAADASIAVAVLKHVFEHTPDPRAALAELRRVLVPGAAVFFAVPHVGYFKARSPQSSRFFRGEAGRAHFVYYSPETLARLLEDEGFRIASVHPRLVHRRLVRRGGGIARLAAELAMLPVRVPLRAVADAFGLRKEFWLVAVRT